jgi:hypothetical protein
VLSISLETSWVSHRVALLDVRRAARSRAGRAKGLPPRGGREERMKGPLPARMPGYGAGSRRLGSTEKRDRMAPVSCAPGPRQFPLHPYSYRILETVR